MSDTHLSRADAPEDQPSADPHNLEAEQALLGALLINNTVYGRVVDFLLPEHFFEALHGRIYEVAAKMIVDGRPCTPISIKSNLPEIDLGGMTVAEYIARLASSAATTVNAAEYARQIHELALRRKLISIGHEIARRAVDTAVDDAPASMIEEAAQELSAMTSSVAGKAREAESVGVVAANVVQRLQDIRSGKVQDEKVKTGLPSLDALLGGIGRQNMVVIAGRPGMGKTGLAIQIAMNIAKTAPVLYFSLEMERGEITERCISNIAYRPGIDPLAYNEIRNPIGLSDRQMERIVDAERALRSCGLIIEDASGLTCEQIIFKARMVASRLALQGKQLGALVVDHMGHIRVPQIKNNPVAAMTYVSGSLKHLAKSISVPMLALSQLNRGIEQRDDKRPQLADLRESGAIEQDADSVIGVYREEYYVNKGLWKPKVANDPPAPSYELEARVLKNRHGKEGPAILWSDMGHNVIAERAV